MNMRAGNIVLKIFAAVAFIAMVAVNFLAQALPINGMTPGEVSDSLPNLFAPAGFTFSIWGLIYLTLAVFTIYQLGFTKQFDKTAVPDKVRALFILSSLANIAWIFSWHYGFFAWSMFLMIVIFVTLIFINLSLDREPLRRAEKLMVRLPFSLYFGWITVATVANATALLVSIGWDRFGLSEQTWAIIILIVAMLIGTATLVRRKDMTYGLVLIWAYVGILIKHLSANGFAGMYAGVIATISACLIVYLAAEGFVIIRSAKRIQQA